MGPEGAGKSTQAKLFAKDCKLLYISTGDMLRFFAQNDKGYLGNAVRAMFARHGYLKSELLNRIVIETLKNAKYKNGVVLDGSLRTFEETEEFDQVLQKTGLDLPVIVFYLNISEDESIKRLTFGRKRVDDTIEGVKARLSHFHNQLKERLAIIREKYQLIEINGEQSEEKVHEEIMNKATSLSSWKEADAD